MAKQHITEDGPKTCTASVRGCRFLPDGHYDTFEEAQSVYENKMAEKYATGSLSKKTLQMKKVYHINLEADKAAACVSVNPESNCRFKEHGHYNSLSEAQEALNKKTKKDTSPQVATRAAEIKEKPSVNKIANASPDTKKKIGLMNRVLGRNKLNSEL